MKKYTVTFTGRTLDTFWYALRHRIASLSDPELLKKGKWFKSELKYAREALKEYDKIRKETLG